MSALSEHDPLGHYAFVKDDNIFLTSSKGFDTITPELNLDEARLHARKILELDCGEHWVDIYSASGKIIERIERQTECK